MAEPETPEGEPNAARPGRKKFGIRYYIGLPLMNLGIVTATMFTMNHLKQQPPEPLGLDLTLRWGYGGFIAYGVAAAILGFLLLLSAARGKKDHLKVLFVVAPVTIIIVGIINYIFL